MMNVKIICTIILLSVFFSGVFAYPGEKVGVFALSNQHPTGLTFDGKNLWLADHKTDQLYCIDPSNGKILREIPSPGYWPMGLAWDGKNLWNVDAKQKKVFKIRPSDGLILNSIDAPSDNPEGLTWDGKTLWISDSRKNLLMQLDLSDGTALHTFDGPAKSLQGLAFDGKYIWCSDRLMNEIYVVRPIDGEVILLTEASGPYPRGMAWDGAHIWIVDYQLDSLFQITHADEQKFKLDNPRKSRITYTHQVKSSGLGKLKVLNVFLAIPEQLNQQNILSINFSPDRYSEKQDRWNQNFAHFTYENRDSGKEIVTIMEIEAEISEISYFIYPDNCGTLTDIPQNVRKLYAQDGSKYLLDDKYIQDLARDIVGDEKNPYWIARKIFDYVRNHLEYKLEGGWNVAPFVLKRGTGSCSEYTFSFIALCRAAGLPARYVGSIVVRGDDASLDEVFHRWPEVYLPNYGWIPIDPQGGDKQSPRDRILNIGHLSNRFLITTQGGGDSEYLGWYYNSHETYQADPKVEVNIENFGDWEPIGR
jgi:hypothetical protein